jgi:hypothetical protein
MIEPDAGHPSAPLSWTFVIGCVERSLVIVTMRSQVHMSGPFSSHTGERRRKRLRVVEFSGLRALLCSLPLRLGTEAEVILSVSQGGIPERRGPVGDLSGSLGL